MPIAHGEGNYFAEPELLASLEANRQVVFRYVDADGQASEAAIPTARWHSIAGICNRARNVVGLMPHPERASRAVDGQRRRPDGAGLGGQGLRRRGRGPAAAPAVAEVARA